MINQFIQKREATFGKPGTVTKEERAYLFNAFNSLVEDSDDANSMLTTFLLDEKYKTGFTLNGSVVTLDNPISNKSLRIYLTEDLTSLSVKDGSENKVVTLQNNVALPADYLKGGVGYNLSLVNSKYEISPATTIMDSDLISSASGIDSTLVAKDNFYTYLLNTVPKSNKDNGVDDKSRFFVRIPKPADINGIVKAVIRVTSTYTQPVNAYFSFDLNITVQQDRRISYFINNRTNDNSNSSYVKENMVAIREVIQSYNDVPHLNVGMIVGHVLDSSGVTAKPSELTSSLVSIKITNKDFSIKDFTPTTTYNITTWSTHSYNPNYSIVQNNNRWSVFDRMTTAQHKMISSYMSETNWLVTNELDGVKNHLLIDATPFCKYIGYDAVDSEHLLYTMKGNGFSKQILFTTQMVFVDSRTIKLDNGNIAIGDWYTKIIKELVGLSDENSFSDFINTFKLEMSDVYKYLPSGGRHITNDKSVSFTILPFNGNSLNKEIISVEQASLSYTLKTADTNEPVIKVRGFLSGDLLSASVNYATVTKHDKEATLLKTLVDHGTINFLNTEARHHAVKNMQNPTAPYTDVTDATTRRASRLSDTLFQATIKRYIKPPMPGVIASFQVPIVGFNTHPVKSKARDIDHRDDLLSDDVPIFTTTTSEVKSDTDMDSVRTNAMTGSTLSANIVPTLLNGDTDVLGVIINDYGTSEANTDSQRHKYVYQTAKKAWDNEVVTMKKKKRTFGLKDAIQAGSYTTAFIDKKLPLLVNGGILNADYFGRRKTLKNSIFMRPSSIVKDYGVTDYIDCYLDRNMNLWVLSTSPDCLGGDVAQTEYKRLKNFGGEVIKDIIIVGKVIIVYKGGTTVEHTVPRTAEHNPLSAKNTDGGDASWATVNLVSNRWDRMKWFDKGYCVKQLVDPDDMHNMTEDIYEISQKTNFVRKSIIANAGIGSYPHFIASLGGNKYQLVVKDGTEYLSTSTTSSTTAYFNTAETVQVNYNTGEDIRHYSVSSNDNSYHALVFPTQMKFTLYGNHFELENTTAQVVQDSDGSMFTIRASWATNTWGDTGSGMDGRHIIDFVMTKLNIVILDSMGSVWYTQANHQPAQGGVSVNVETLHETTGPNFRRLMTPCKIISINNITNNGLASTRLVGEDGSVFFMDAQYVERSGAVNSTDGETTRTALQFPCVNFIEDDYALKSKIGAREFSYLKSRGT